MQDRILRSGKSRLKKAVRKALVNEYGAHCVNGSLGRYFSREGLTFDPEHQRFRYEAQVVLPQQ